MTRLVLRRALSVPTCPGLLCLWVLAGCLGLSRLGGQTPGEAHPMAGMTAVVANASVPESVAVARHYMQARGIPEDHLLLIESEATEVIRRSRFAPEIWNPLLQQLLDKGMLRGQTLDQPDALGRLQAPLTLLRLRYLVLCYGVPYRIHEAKTGDRNLAESFFKRLYNLEPERSAQFYTGNFNRSAATVDAELALLALHAPPALGIIPNPLFKAPDRGAAGRRILRVTRLDGPTPESAQALVDQALAGERLGLRGRFYLDPGTRSGPGYDRANAWMQAVATQGREAGFPTEVDAGSGIFGPATRFDGPAVYFGWYRAQIAGIFAVPDFRFPPGAIGAHLHSYSAASLRDRNGWVAGFVARGITATVGNTAEPYLATTHHFDLMMEALQSGAPWGDAAYVSLPYLSWQPIVIGDPLYQPFRHDWLLQLEHLRAGSTDPWDDYVLLRELLRLESIDQEAEALRLGRGHFRDRPEAEHPASALHVARRLADARERREGRALLARAAQWPFRGGSDYRLFQDIADQLDDWGDEASALVIYRRLLAVEGLPKAFETSLLRRGIRLADTENDRELERSWRDRRKALEAAED